MALEGIKWDFWYSIQGSYNNKDICRRLYDDLWQVNGKMITTDLGMHWKQRNIIQFGSL